MVIYMNLRKNVKKIKNKLNIKVFILILVIFQGVLIRLLKINTSYPIGWDAAQYFALSVWYSKYWPKLPTEMPYYGGVPLTATSPPFVPWTMVLISKIIKKDFLFTLEFTRILVFIINTLLIFYLTKEFTNRYKISILASFFYVINPFILYYTFPAAALRTEYVTIFLSVIIIFILKLLKNYENFKEDYKINLNINTRYIILIGISGLFLFLVQIDQPLMFLLPFYFTMMLVSILEKKRFKNLTKLILTIAFINFVPALPIIYIWKEFLINRLGRFLSTFMNKSTTSVVASVATKQYGFPEFGYIITFLSFIGCFVIIRHRNFKKIPILSLFISMYFIGKLSYFNLNPFPQRFYSIASVPASILASIGFFWIINLLSKYSLKIFNFFNESKNIIIIIMVSFLLINSFITGITALSNSTPKSSFLSKEYKEAYLWIKYNTPEDSIIYTSINFFGAIQYIIGFSDRYVSYSVSRRQPPGNYFEFISGYEAWQVISKPNNRSMILQILSKHPNSYVAVAKKGFASTIYDPELKRNVKINIHKLENYYEKVFENEAIVIFKVK